MRVPGSCSEPVRRSRTYPSTRPTTHDWQMPIRQPNGICTPAFSPASISEVAASASIVLPLRPKVTVPPWPWARRPRRREALQVQTVGDPGRLPHLVGRVEHAFRTAGPGLPLPPVRNLVVQPLQIQPALGAGGAHRQPVALVRARQIRELRGEHDVGLRWGGMDVDDIAELLTAFQRAQHRHHRGDPGAPGQEQQRRRRGIGQHEVPLRGGQPHDRAGCDAADQVSGQEALGHGLDRDGDGARAARMSPGPTSASTTATASARRPAGRCRRTDRAGSRR